MKVPKWISTTDALLNIANERLGEFVEDHTVEVYKAARALLLESLIDGTLPSRPVNPSEYSCVFESERNRDSYPLNDDGTIPQAFWFHFKEACDRKAVTLVALKRDWARFDECIEFVCTGLVDDGRLIGSAGTVLVERSKLPGRHRRRRGERGAPYAEKDAEIVMQAIEAFRCGESFASIVKRFAQMMPGDGTSESRERRLRNRLKEQGLTSRILNPEI